MRLTAVMIDCSHDQTECSDDLSLEKVQVLTLQGFMPAFRPVKPHLCSVRHISTDGTELPFRNSLAS